LAIYVEGALSYSAVIPIGARNVTNDLAIGMRISLSSAETIKLSLNEKQIVKTEAGSNTDILKQKREEDKLDLTKLKIKEDIKTASRKTLVEGIIRPRLNEIFTMVGRELKKANMIGLTPAGVVVTGGGASTVGAVDACKRTLSLPARIGVPKGLSGLTEELESPEYATASGLILYASGRTPASSGRFGFGGIGKAVSRIPVKGAADKAISFIKSLLP
jgi:cell division protein FtsA